MKLSRRINKVIARVNESLCRNKVGKSSKEKYKEFLSKKENFNKIID